ncbi:MAG: hypothetical protein K8L91_31705 [Anaerolineae bacterium]|nr:hypothetical protein [Anaerolineae bacterium]
MADRLMIEIFDDCVERLHAGQSVEDILHQYPNYADTLRPMLEITRGIQRVRVPSAEISASQDRIRSRVLHEYHAAPTRRYTLPPVLSMAAALLLACLCLFGGGAGLVATGIIDLDNDDVQFGTPSAQPSITDSPTATFSLTASGTPTATATASLTRTSTSSPTASPSRSSTPTATASSTRTLTATSTRTASRTPSMTASRTPSSTLTRTPAPTNTSLIPTRLPASQTPLPPQNLPPTDDDSSGSNNDNGSENDNDDDSDGGDDNDNNNSNDNGGGEDSDDD